MSIAVSTAVCPSRILFGLTAGMCGILMVVAALIGFEIVGDTTIFVRVGLALVCCGFAFFAYCRALAQSKTGYLIHISGLGQIRVSRAKNINKTPAEWKILRADEQGEVVQLLPVSTLWTSLMILHFHHADKHTSRIVILPDALSDSDSKADRWANFSALLVSLRWALRHQTAEYAQPEKSI